MRLSQSFNEDEVAWLDQVLRTLQRGGDCRVLARSPLLGAWRRKVTSMKQRAERIRQKGTQEVIEFDGGPDLPSEDVARPIDVAYSSDPKKRRKPRLIDAHLPLDDE